MSLIDRYLFRQLLGPTILATLALSGVALISEALSSIGVMLNQRQSPLVFAKIVLLAMPQLVVLILPVAVMVAGMMTINRMHRDNEIAVCFASGVSRWRVISPGMRLAVLVALISLAVSLWIQPLCYRALRDTLESARADLLTTMIRPGQFTHPAPGVTIYAQSIDEDGVIGNLFIDQRLPSGRETTIMARQGRLQHGQISPVLILQRGENQELSAKGALSFLSFDQYLLDLRTLMIENPTVRYKLSDRFPHELFQPDLRMGWERANRGAMSAEVHARMASTLYNPAFMLLALTAVIGGGFSRFGYGARIAASSGAAVAARLLGFALQAAAGASPALNVLQYATPLAVCMTCLWMLLHVGRRLPANDAPDGA